MNFYTQNYVVVVCISSIYMKSAVKWLMGAVVNGFK